VPPKGLVVLHNDNSHVIQSILGKDQSAIPEGESYSAEDTKKLYKLALYVGGSRHVPITYGQRKLEGTERAGSSSVLLGLLNKEAILLNNLMLRIVRHYHSNARKRFAGDSRCLRF